MRTTEEMTDVFRASGRKVTAQRQCIFRILEGNHTHPSAEAVFERARAEVATISLKTVYQTLHELAEMGEISMLDLGTGTVRFDPNIEHAHDHLVCRACGRIRDVEVSDSAPPVPAGLVRGFRVTSAEVVYRGICAECRRAQ